MKKTVRIATAPEIDVAYSFWVIAAQFLYAYKRVQGSALIYPEGFCLGHAIELLLKSFLLKKGAPKKVLQHQYGHNIAKLLTEAEARGLKLKKSDKRHIISFAPWFSDFLFRYGADALRSTSGQEILFSHPDRVSTAAQNLMSFVYQDCFMEEALAEREALFKKATKNIALNKPQ